MNKLFEFDKKEKSGLTGALRLSLGTHKFLLGTDEAGRGPAAGGVFAACVCFFDDIDFSLLNKLNDSKKISEKTREELYAIIKTNSIWAIKCVEVETIEKFDILQSSLLAMNQSVTEVINKLGAKPTDVFLLIDGNRQIKFDIPQKTVIKGDMKSAAIAAASILAKVERDRYMLELDEKYPLYNFKENKGYLTKDHIEAIKKHGITPVHRVSFLEGIKD